MMLHMFYKWFTYFLISSYKTGLITGLDILCVTPFAMIFRPTYMPYRLYICSLTIFWNSFVILDVFVNIPITLLLINLNFPCSFSTANIYFCDEVSLLFSTAVDIFCIRPLGSRLGS
uniref:Uncharacterized protein n=1 Tax=Babesia bovis TaxID=5865 RepID=S6C7H3_BABBO|nr:hypothetical protein [Babesia bovis]